MRRLSRAHEDARNLCVDCGQFGWRGNPVTRRTADPVYRHVECRRRLQRGEPCRHNVLPLPDGRRVCPICAEAEAEARA